MSKMTVDDEVYALADYYLDNKGSEEDTMDLAQTIQRAIEDWLARDAEKEAEKLKRLSMWSDEDDRRDLTAGRWEN